MDQTLQRINLPYLRHRAHSWSFSLAVPPALRQHFKSNSGKERARIVIGLGTDSLAEAKKRAVILRAEWLVKFDVAAREQEVPGHFTRPIIQGDGRLRFLDASELLLAELQRDPAAAPRQQTIIGARAIHNLFCTAVENAPINAITRTMANDFLAKVGTERKLSNRSLNKYAATLSQVFRHARDAGRLESPNPFERRGFRVPQGTGWTAFTPEELKLLLPAEPMTPLDWCIWISAYSGMRLNEIAGLQTGDLKKEGGIDGIWYFDLHERHRRLKTAAASRRVPIHSRLFDAGVMLLLVMIDQGPLWPSLRPAPPDFKVSKGLSEKFTDYRRKLGVNRPRVSFHSLRGGFITELDRAGVHQSDIAALVGHRSGFTLDTYSGGPGLRRLQNAVETVVYDGI
jgi:integrase